MMEKGQLMALSSSDSQKENLKIKKIRLVCEDVCIEGDGG